MVRRQLVLAGAPLDTGNRGVEALGRSTLDAIDASSASAHDPWRVMVLDNGWGVRPQPPMPWPDTQVTFAGARRTRRAHRPESWTQIMATLRWGRRLNAVARTIAGADALLDLSGGDSFTDLYGPTRLATVSAPKIAALRARTPLVLLPQTYGPFTTPAGRDVATRLIQGSHLAYSRDALSHERLLDLAGPGADRSRLRPGVDVAFALQARQPGLIPPALARHSSRDQTPLVGINISGLLQTPEAAERFALAGDYLETMHALVRALLDRGADVVFIPHVHVANSGGESDLMAIERVRSRLSAPERARAIALPPALDAAELKWCLARMDWVVGSRMHATIGSLSSQVPTLGYAYSDKARGVFETCGAADAVLDARRVSGPDAVAAMIASYEDRERQRDILSRTVPPVVDRARDQLLDLLTTVESWSDGIDPGSIA